MSVWIDLRRHYWNLRTMSGLGLMSKSYTACSDSLKLQLTVSTSLHLLSPFSSLSQPPSVLYPFHPQANWGRWLLLFSLFKALSCQTLHFVSECLCMCLCFSRDFPLVLNLNWWLWKEPWCMLSPVRVWVNEREREFLMALFSSSSGLSKCHSLGLNMQLIYSAW